LHRPKRRKGKTRTYFRGPDKSDFTAAGPVTITKANGEVEVREPLGETEFQKIVKVRRVSERTRQKVIRRDGKCRYCGAKSGPWEVDHVVAVSIGGTNRLGNLVLSCVECNQRKGVDPWRPKQ